MGRPRSQKRLLDEYLNSEYGIQSIERPNSFKSRFIVRNIEDIPIIISSIKEHYKWEDLYFRGQCCEDWELLPSLSRHKSYIPFEHQMFKELYGIFQFNQPDKCRQQIFNAQHYGLYTRMLDITSDWKIALWFACQRFLKNNGQEHDCEIIVMNGTNDINRNVEKFIYWQIQNSSILNQYTKIELIKKYCAELNIKEDNFSEELDLYESVGIRSLFLIEPKDKTIRIKNQKAYGLLLPTFFYKGYARKHIKSAYRKDMVSLYIPGHLKLNFLKKLEDNGITKKFIYADNKKEEKFINKCQEIIEHYKEDNK